ncbi:radical SAM family heme chaperone HemW [Brevibacterium daeguense]|uniref:Heme chaperone HemW n=1 Tax=Brevibacterium daeguense TaxID=909936 RepID=A0ABP8EMZ1_9MICO|nr:radical SAM family heme chaperone HemW [Brevibacterium daeguense]
MPAQPDGETPPADGSLPPQVAGGAADRSLSLYVHVPYCRTRCGYCDFNTYTVTELGPGASRSDYRATVAAELDLSLGVMGRAQLEPRAVSTIFFGGGTPTMLDAQELAGVLGDIRERFELDSAAEVTTEANPDTLSPAYVRALADAGFTRVSLGMQSAVPHVLRTLDRTHEAERIPEVVQWIKDAGLDVSLDLIYGTPGESLTDWHTSVEAALACRPDHISAYSLIVEPGTRMGVQVRRGELPMPDEDDLADKYELAEALLASAGFGWYEVSNWAIDEKHRCEHNLAYWRNADWWGYGPGAHSHIGGVRFWNAKHPRAWSDRLRAGRSPAVGREVLDDTTREIERLLLGARIHRGLLLDSLPESSAGLIREFQDSGLLDPAEADAGFWTPTLQGRLLADHMVRRLTDFVI